jgi:hypothetical protein
MGSPKSAEAVRPAPWSKRTDQLVRTIAAGSRPRLQLELGHWLEDNPRFRTFVEANAEKVRKKLSVNDEEARLAVRAELLVTQRLLLDRRFEVAFEAYGAGRVGPDLSVAFRVNQRFNLEVTRLRTAPEAAKVANVIGAKLRQLPQGVPNALVITGERLELSTHVLADAARNLKERSIGPLGAQYLRLSGVFSLDEDAGQSPVSFWANREARQPLPETVVAAVSACLAA